MSRLGLERSPGEAAGEICYSRGWQSFTLWVKRELDGGLWDWILLDGSDAIAFGDGITQADAERQLTEAVAEHCPELLGPPERRPLLFDASGRPFEASE
jgi:hypothetical protein